MQLHLRGKIILPTICLFVLTTSVSLFLMENRMQNELGTLVTERLESELRTVSTGLHGMRDSLIRDLENMAHMSSVQRLLDPSLSGEELKTALTDMNTALSTDQLLTSEVFREISLVDREGRILLSSAKGLMPLAHYRTGTNGTLSAQAVKVRDPKLLETALREKKTSFGSVVDVEASASSDPKAVGKAFVPVVTPVLDAKSGAVLGAVEAYINFAKLSALFVDPVAIKKQGVALVVTDGGYIISNGIFTMKKPGPGWRTPNWLQTKSGKDEYFFADQTWIALYDTDPLTRWTSVVKVSKPEVFAPIDDVIILGRIANALSLGVVAVFLFLVTTYLVRDLRKTVLFAGQIADGDLQQTLTVASKDEIGQLSIALNRMIESLRSLLTTSERRADEAKEQTERAERAVRDAEASRQAAEKARAEGIHHAASQLETLVNSLNAYAATLEERISKAARGAEQQRHQSEENMHALERMNGTVHKVGQSAADASHSASDARNLAESGVKAVADVADAIQQVNAQAVRLKQSLNALGTRAEGIGQVMSVISDIADQTNLLALNAAIEAARAGEAGRGFAVVADEVRKLAEKTMTATREVGESVTAIQSATQDNISMMDATSRTVDQTTSLATGAGDALLAIVQAVKNNAAQIDTIAAAGMEQIDNSKTITRGIEAIDGISVATAQLMVEARHNLESVTQTTGSLNTLLQNLKK